MRKIHTVNDVLLLSNKDVDSIQGSYVFFKDGSTANLEELSFTNRGTGEIKFKFLDEIDMSENSRIESLEFSQQKDVYFSGDNIYFEIHHVEGNKNLIDIIGTDHFHSEVEVSKTFQGLVIKFPERDNNTVIGDTYINGRRVKSEPIEGKIILKTPLKPAVHIKNNGGGFGQVNVSAELLDMNSNGSLRLECASIDNVSIQMNGSSQVEIQEVLQSCDIKSNGSGIVTIETGQLPLFKASNNGSGTINARIIAQRAELTNTGCGSIFITQVVEESFEVHGGTGEVNILKRGQ